MANEISRELFSCVHVDLSDFVSRRYGFCCSESDDNYVEISPVFPTARYRRAFSIEPVGDNFRLPNLAAILSREC